MAVLNTTSPVVLPLAPMERPWKTVPSSSASTAGSIGHMSSRCQSFQARMRTAGGACWPIPLHKKFHRVLKEGSLRE